MANLTGKYYVKKSLDGTWEDVTSKFDGLKILSLDGFNEEGDAVNVYTEQFIDSQVEDFMVTKKDGSGNDVIIRKNVDLSMTFIVARRYASTSINEQTVYDSFRDYVCKGGSFYIKSAYVNKYVHVVCIEGFKPIAQKLNRGSASFILATIQLHTLDKPVTA